ncbi:hypothetical protein ABIB26_002336 [Arthrobacter sp. UYEF20]
MALDGEAMRELWDRSTAALADGPQPVLDRFDRLIRCLALFHAHRGEPAFIALSEIRSLEGSARAGTLRPATANRRCGAESSTRDRRS